MTPEQLRILIYLLTGILFFLGIGLGNAFCQPKLTSKAKFLYFGMTVGCGILAIFVNNLVNKDPLIADNNTYAIIGIGYLFSLVSALIVWQAWANREDKPLDSQLRIKLLEFVKNDVEERWNKSLDKLTMIMVSKQSISQPIAEHKPPKGNLLNRLVVKTKIFLRFAKLDKRSNPPNQLNNEN